MREQKDLHENDGIISDYIPKNMAEVNCIYETGSRAKQCTKIIYMYVYEIYGKVEQ